uniref:Uncharacterized protein n=1 Tax=Eutreptiella gymnastica TaxID=73025 RepID=A0A7S4LE11_9EUGL
MKWSKNRILGNNPGTMCTCSMIQHVHHSANVLQREQMPCHSRHSMLTQGVLRCKGCCEPQEVTDLAEAKGPSNHTHPHCAYAKDQPWRGTRKSSPYNRGKQAINKHVPPQQEPRTTITDRGR